MCIRDRSEALIVEQFIPKQENIAEGSQGNRPADVLGQPLPERQHKGNGRDDQPVSYTHLALPFVPKLPGFYPVQVSHAQHLLPYHSALHEQCNDDICIYIHRNHTEMNRDKVFRLSLPVLLVLVVSIRSEERRVGKECRL